MNIAYLTSGLDFGERASTSGVVTLQGMLTIFLVLALLWGAIEIMHRLIHRNEGTKKEESPKKAVAPAANGTDDAAVAAAIAAAIAASEDEGAIVAAITAAITAAREEEGCTGEFRVVSFKRAPSANARRKF